MIERPKDREDEYRVRRNTVRLLSIPEHRFVMVDGSGPAAGEPFEARMPGPYAVAFGLRFALKRRGVHGKVGPLEGRWWHAGGATDLDEILAGDRSAWRWNLMIVVPLEATEAEIEMQLGAGKEKVEPEIAASLRVESFEEGDVAQVLHVGPYAEERASIERLRGHRRSRLQAEGPPPRAVPRGSPSHRTRASAHDPSSAHRVLTPQGARPPEVRGLTYAREDIN